MIGFDNIKDNLIDISEFRLNWRFTDSKYNILQNEHLEQLKPLNKTASNFLWNHIMTVDLHKDTPFHKSFFKSIDKAKIIEGNESEIKK